MPPKEITGATPAKPMAENRSKALADVLRQIRDNADAALRQLHSIENPRHLGWRCTSCG